MKHILIYLSLFISADLYAQDTLKVEELVTKNKVELTQIYINKVVVLLWELPATAVNESDIPNNKYLLSQFRDIEKSAEKNALVVIEKYKSIIPYADKDKLIDAIMFFKKLHFK